MRITSSSYYNNIYGENNKLNRQLFDVNKQISSGQQIQYSHENPEIFIDTMRLDDEITTLTQIKSSSLSAYKISTQTDTTMSDMVKTLESMKVKLVSAANDAHSDTSIQALAKELRGLQNHLLNIANSSIGGKYIFSGTAVNEKPIDANGVYQGNNEDMLAFIGSGLKQKFNISGTQLFLGEESKVARTVTSNVPQLSLNDLYPDLMQDPGTPRSLSKQTYITANSTIRDLMGDNDSILTNDTLRQAHFYVQGTKTTGETFKTKISLNMDDTVNDLIREVSDAYGTNQVDVSINAHGQIEIADKHMGSSKLDFHMVGAVDFDSAGADTADVSDISTLQYGTSDFLNDIADPIANGQPMINPLYIKEFTRSGINQVTSASAVTAGNIAAGDLIINGFDIGAVTTLNNDTDNALLNTINSISNLTKVTATRVNGELILNSLTGDDIVLSGNPANAANTLLVTGFTLKTYNVSGLDYEKIPFTQDGAFLRSNTSQIVNSDNSYANPMTKLLNTSGAVTMDGKQLLLHGKDVYGTPYSVQINLSNNVTLPNTGSTFSLDGGVTNYPIFSALYTDANLNGIKDIGEGQYTKADEMTYQQLLDVVNMAMTGNFPAGMDATDYDNAVAAANNAAATTLDYRGRIIFEDKTSPITQASISMYDANSGDFSAAADILAFNTNSALTIRDPKKDFFAEIEEMIRSVEEARKRADGGKGINPRNIGIQNAITKLDDLSEHVTRLQTEVGSYSQVLQATSDRTDLLIVSTKRLQSDVLDTDIAEASMRMQQLTLNYQALLSNISKVSKLSLVNYL